MLAVYAEHHARITADVLSFDGAFPVMNTRFSSVQDEPDRRNMWAAVRTNGGDLRSAPSKEQKRMPTSLGLRSMWRIIRVPSVTCGICMAG